MPVAALVIGTFALWITAKGELGKYLKLATTSNPNNPLKLPSVAFPGGNVVMSPSGATTNTPQGSLYIPSLTP